MTQTPHNTKQEWKIGDCLELLPELEDNSFDMVLTSPRSKTRMWMVIIGIFMINFSESLSEWQKILR